MRNPITRILSLITILLLCYHFSCGEVCHMKKLNKENIEKMNILSGQITKTKELLSGQIAEYIDLNKKVKYGSGLIGMYEQTRLDIVYAGRDDAEVLKSMSGSILTGTTRDDIGSQKPNSIILHHSAQLGSNNYAKVLTSINRTHTTRVHGLQPSNQLRDDYKDISYHYVIFPNGHIEQTRRETRVGRGTKENNEGVIHILLIGDFTKEQPTEEQYNALNSQITDIQSRRAIGSIKGHGDNDGEHTSCPGDKFDLLRVDQIRAWTPVIEKPKGKPLGNFKMTSYYSPQANQSSYFYSHELKRNRTVVEEVRMNCGYNDTKSLAQNIEQCKYSANGRELHDDHAGKVVACPKEIGLNTKLYIEGLGEVTCVDRGGSIITNRLDFRSGYGQKGLDNIKQGKLGIPKNANVYVVE